MATANMILLVNDVELSIPQGTSAAYLVELIGALSSDFRKSINGFTAVIESDADLLFGSGALFLFTNKQRDKIKTFGCAKCFGSSKATSRLGGSKRGTVVDGFDSKLLYC